jgi:hypothetical protein
VRLPGGIRMGGVEIGDSGRTPAPDRVLRRSRCPKHPDDPLARAFDDDLDSGRVEVRAFPAPLTSAGSGSVWLGLLRRLIPQPGQAGFLPGALGVSDRLGLRDSLEWVESQAASAASRTW